MKPRSFLSAKTVSLAIVALIVIVAIAYATISSNNDTGQSNAASGNSSSGSTASGSNQQNVLVIKELSVQLTLPQSIAGTTYSVTKRQVPKNSKYTLPPMVDLHTKEYTTLVSNCLKNTDSNTNYPYATLSKVTGQAPAASQNVLKQFKGFYIEKIAGGINPQCSDQNDQKALDDLQNSLNDGLAAAFSKAQQIK